VLAPNQRSVLAQLGVKSLIGGTLCCFLGASIAAMFT
jgi:CNT family concentrative nucleoside transporter